MNAEGSLFNQVEDVSKTAAKDATSNEALKSYAIAGGTALLTFGMSQGIEAIATSPAALIKRFFVEFFRESVKESPLTTD